MNPPPPGFVLGPPPESGVWVTILRAVGGWWLPRTTEPCAWTITEDSAWYRTGTTPAPAPRADHYTSDRLSITNTDVAHRPQDER